MKSGMISNAVWMMSEKVVSVFGVIFVTSYVAKIFGPTIFGQISFAASVFSVVQSIALFGTESLLFKCISKNVVQGMRMMLVAKRLRIALLLVFSVPLLFYIWLTMREDFFFYAAASFFSSVYIIQDIFSVYNNARLASHQNTIANTVGLLTGFAVSFTIAYLKLQPRLLSISIVATTMVPYLIKRAWFFQKNNTVLPAWRRQRNYLRYLLCAGLPLAITGVFIAIQVKLAQFFLAGVGSAQQLGLFAAATTVSSSWIFIPVAIITSCFSGIFRARKNDAFILAAKLNGYVIAICLLILSITDLFGDKILVALYGHRYAESGNIIILLSLATSFSAIGTVAHRYIVKEGGFHYLLMKIIALVAISVVINGVFISTYGLLGAAWSVLITEILSATIMNYFFSNRLILNIQISSLNYKIYK